MKCIIKKITFSILSLMICSVAIFAQVEVKINPVGALFNSPDLSVEFIATDNVGIEGRVGYSWGDFDVDGIGYKSRGLVFIGAGRYYFNPSVGGNGFYTGGYVKYKNSGSEAVIGESREITNRRLAVGPVFGYKVLSGNQKVVFDFNFGIGKAFVNDYSNNATEAFLDAVPFGDTDLIGTLALGYRF